MGSYTETELASLTNAALDFYIKGEPMAQALQERPLLKALREKTRTFSGGKEFIRKNVKGTYTTTFQGFSHDDTVSYGNPANIKQTQWKWYEMHGGIGVPFTELKAGGITVLPNGSTSDHSKKDRHEISNILADKMDDLMEGTARSFNNICWQDGSQDALVFPGMQHIIADTPTTGVLAGIDRAQTDWWRSRSRVGASLLTADTTNFTISLTIQDDLLQLRRYGGRPNRWLGGSTAFSALTKELFAKGNPYYVNRTEKGAMELGQEEISVVGMGTFTYDPTLDDLGYDDYQYMFDTRHLTLWAMEDEDMRKHTPGRPVDKYVHYVALTYTGCMAADQVNCHQVQQLATS